MFARARLSGSYDDYAAAQRALDAAFRTAPPGAGPHLSQAILHLMLHRLDGAEEMLDATARYVVPPDAGEAAEIAGMRGDIAFYRGDYRGALAHYDAADRIEPGAADFRRAVFHSKTGNPLAALRFFDSYEARLVRRDRHMRANMALQRGIVHLDNGRLDEAMAWFRRAEALFPGWWLVEEHIAETTALLGDKEGAERRYRRVIERTQAPEFMDALAALLLERGATEEAELLSSPAAAPCCGTTGSGCFPKPPMATRSATARPAAIPPARSTSPAATMKRSRTAGPGRNSRRLSTPPCAPTKRAPRSTGCWRARGGPLPPTPPPSGSTRRRAIHPARPPSAPRRCAPTPTFRSDAAVLLI